MGNGLDQDLLLPVSLREWLPTDHLAYIVIDIVNQLDITGMCEKYRRDGRGGWAYHPLMMLATLCYCYMTGVVSSRGIEQRCREDVPTRIVSRNTCPDHATFARFRRDNPELIAALYAKVLRLCVHEGLVSATVLAVDGTKIPGNASLESSFTVETLARMVIEHAEAHDQEDERRERQHHLDGIDASCSEVMRPGSDREARIRKALAELDAEQAAAAQATGRDAPHGTKHSSVRKKGNVTDPDSRGMTSRHGMIQGYNVQIMVDSHEQVIVAQAVTQDRNDTNQLVPLMTQMTDNLQGAGIDQIGVVLADHGYLTEPNARVPNTLIGVDAPTTTPEKRRAVQRRRIHDTAAKVAQGILTRDEGAHLLGVKPDTMRKYVYTWYKQQDYNARHTRDGPDHENDEDDDPDPIGTMAFLLEEPANKQLYRRRCGIVEPVFGQIKHNHHFTRFSQRGLPYVTTEWTLVCVSHNIRKLAKHTTRTLPA